MSTERFKHIADEGMLEIRKVLASRDDEQSELVESLAETTQIAKAQRDETRSELLAVVDEIQRRESRARVVEQS